LPILDRPGTRPQVGDLDVLVHFSEAELSHSSVERVVEYLELPQEPPVIMESSRPPAYWPSSESDSLVVVEDLVIKYASELPPVLHNVSFTLRGRERVGLLGRTGTPMLHRF
jgi:ABC-type multidrug transport system fused ATPase/permease subunit